MPAPAPPTRKSHTAGPIGGAHHVRRRWMMVSGYVLRRLYSTFATGWPGIGLLVMRLVVSAVLLSGTWPELWNHPPFYKILTAAPLAVSGILLAAGLWTPVVGAVVAVIQLSDILKGAGHPLVSLLAGTMAAALAMLGPGRWSVDSRLFGWKRIEAPVRHEVIRAQNSKVQEY